MLAERRDFRKVSTIGVAIGNPRVRDSDSPPPQREGSKSCHVGLGTQTQAMTQRPSTPTLVMVWSSISKVSSEDSA